MVLNYKRDDSFFFAVILLMYSCAVSLLVMLYCLSQARSWVWSTLTLSVDPEDFLVSVGVIIFSYTSQIFLPSVEGSMEDRRQFNAMLGWTHGAACIMKTLFALLVSQLTAFGPFDCFVFVLVGIRVSCAHSYLTCHRSIHCSVSCHCQYC